LVVIAIIGILVSLLLPAVQSAREAGRRTQCSNQLKQIALAAIQHHESLHMFPTGGWGYMWVGDPDRGFNIRQPGGWIYNVLPFIEEQPLHNLGAGDIDKKPSRAKLLATPVAWFYCPSRRDVGVYHTGYGAYNSLYVEKVSKSDYVANGGRMAIGTGPGPPDLPTGDDPNYLWTPNQGFTGICFMRSAIGAAHITDGLSHTYLVGEKALNPDHYTTGADGGDDQSAYSGYDADVVRFARDVTDNPAPPVADTPGYPSFLNFGSPHPGAFNFAFCDGSVHPISYEIEQTLHENLCNRKDGQVIDTSGL
jgi:prepilin-type processing-associated H-X9-DG protein